MIGAVAAQAVPQVHAEPGTSVQQFGQAAPDADRLFEEGRLLAKRSRFVEACARFTESDAIRRTFGTAVNLGDCAKRDGHAGLAWQLYDAAARLADRDGAPDLTQFARERASSVASELCTIVVTIADPTAAGMTVRIGGRAVPPAAEVRVLVDPGEVDVVVAVPAVRVAEKARCIAAGELATVEIPADRLRVASASPVSQVAPAERPKQLMADANVGIAAAQLVGGLGWLPYVAVGVTIGGWLSPRLAIGGHVTGLIGTSTVRVMLTSPDRLVTGGPVIGGFVGPAAHYAAGASLVLGAGAGLGALLASPVGRMYGPALQVGAIYSPSAVWQVSLEGLGMKETARVGAVIVVLIGARLR